MRHAWKRNILCCGIFIVMLIIFLHPDMNARRSYEYIEKNDILSNLFEKTAENFTSPAVLHCEYHNLLFDDTTLSISLVDGDLVEGHKIKEGGEYSPSECKPRFSTAIIVPYRNRAEQLRGFLVYMHTFLHHQCIHYRIYVVEQLDSRMFNRAKLLNIGALAAMRSGYPCLILHDVDLLPLRPGNLYACTKQPRHMSSSINKFRYVLPYLNVFGGAVAIASNQYKAVNGMSNEYFGWGGEDDDFYARLEAKGLKMSRFEPETSRYHMVSHKSQHKGSGRQKLKVAKERMASDGLNSLTYTEIATVLHPLFTHIMVDL
ncbi:beta-1,4-galactosyltransferase 1-like [Galleria mellonella]|uniref:Beta-1,4-N-acetylgalactosaminyltransferase n=1 Tax=Galleria mellonella TaxID=7137 RepID=A0ABM3MED2_GALME|nr:beta-1,4-galactosyltransferase 1-like [Galleria mellonella]